MTKQVARLHGLIRARAPWHTMRPQAGDLPGIFVMEFGQATGPAVLQDGRELRAVITPAELADVLEALPALSMTGSDDAQNAADLRALLRVGRILRGEPRP